MLRRDLPPNLPARIRRGTYVEVQLAGEQGQDLAGGPYHVISGYLSFPFAIAAMMLFDKMLNLQPGRLKAIATEKEKVSYDY